MSVNRVLLVEDNERLRLALRSGLEETGAVQVAHACDTGEEAVEYCLEEPPEVILMDVQLAGQLNGIEAAVAIIMTSGRLIRWDDVGTTQVLDERGEWVDYD